MQRKDPPRWTRFGCPGSPESNDPYQPDPEPPLTDRSPWPARVGGRVRWLYERSLALAFLLMFLVSLALHAAAGAAEYSAEQLAHGQSAVTTWSYLARSRFWFESMQNWQSEFLAIGMMVVLSIFLRHKGSAESKHVNTPHGENE